MGYKIGAAMLLLLVAVLSVSYAQFQTETGGCRTPDNRLGDCRDLKQCPELMSRLTDPNRTNEDIEFLRDSSCGFQGNNPQVCCASSGNGNQNAQPPNRPTTSRPTTSRPPNGGNNNNNNNNNNQQVNNQLLPTDCGRSESDRIVGGTATSFWDYPWMALLEYDTPNGLKMACGGALINNRYVLTAAHCLKGRTLPATWKLNRVRLGEYNIQTQQDCIPDGLNNRICADSPVSVPIDERLAHEDYDPFNADQRYDIALLRLSRDVPFSPFIRPVCVSRSSQVEPKFVVAGWGRTETRGQSDVKLQVTVPYVDNRRCGEIYQGLGVRIGEGQMCAGGEQGKDSCTGDSGGPLMQQERDANGVIRWYAVGVVSFGPRLCGTVGVPGVYSRVYDYMPWINSKLRR